MSTDVSAVCLRCRRQIHLCYLPHAFGHGRNDGHGHDSAIAFIGEHLRCPDLRIIHSEEVPGDCIDVGEAEP